MFQEPSTRAAAVPFCTGYGSLGNMLARPGHAGGLRRRRPVSAGSHFGGAARIFGTTEKVLLPASQSPPKRGQGERGGGPAQARTTVCSPGGPRQAGVGRSGRSHPPSHFIQTWHSRERDRRELPPTPPSLRGGISPTAASSLIPPSIRDSPSAPSCFLQIKTPPTSGLQRDGSRQAPAPDTLTVQQQAPRAVEGCFFF